MYGEWNDVKEVSEYRIFTYRKCTAVIAMVSSTCPISGLFSVFEKVANCDKNVRYDRVEESWMEWKPQIAGQRDRTAAQGAPEIQFLVTSHAKP